MFGSGVVDHGGAVEKRYDGGGFSAAEQGRRAAAVISAAQKEIGVQESSENAGERVDEYNAYAGVKKAKWCASFVSWCHGQAGFAAPRTAWSPSLFLKDRIAKTAMPGLVMGMYFDQLKRIAHCGIVERTRNDLIYSIEGNTNINGGREGDGVYRKIRHRRTIHSYADWLSSPSLREGTTKQPSLSRALEGQNKMHASEKSHICFGIVQWTDRVQGDCFGSLQSGLAMTGR